VRELPALLIGLGFIGLGFLGACIAPPERAPSSAVVVPSPAPISIGTHIVIAGKRVDIGAPVVLWFEESGYNAYSTQPHFSEEGDVGLRYTPGRSTDTANLGAAVAARLQTGTASVAELAEVVDQFVIHYDACGTSRICFKVLQDMRSLSVHFMLDLDGTLYQTLDLKDKAWHAAKANGRSVGVEIAQIGAYPPGTAMKEDQALGEWYEDSANGETRITLPKRFDGGHFYSPNPVMEPATDGRTTGFVQGQELEQYDFTSAQYETLAHLAAALNRELPKIELDAPRDQTGGVSQVALSEAEWVAYQGLLGHFHVTTRKIDPGPAFDWEGVLSRARELR
jgi:N-acetyl-anhydromuramyl-L-alanine amidase AmpD